MPIEHVAETMRPLPIEPLSGTPNFVIGVSIVRGTPIPVVDVSQVASHLGQPAPQRFVTVKLGVRRAALAVTSVVGVRPLSQETLGTLPGLLQGAADFGIAAVGKLDNDLLVVLSATRLIPEAVWAAIDQQEGRGD